MLPCLEALLRAEHPGRMLCESLRAGSWPRLPFLGDAAHIPAGPYPYHTGSVLAHLTRCMDAVAGDPLAVWMAFVHDAGKLTTPRALLPHHYGHELRGARLASAWAEQLRLPESWRDAGCLAARLHMKAGRYAQLRAGTRYDLLQALAQTPFAASFWRLVDADTNRPAGRRAQQDWAAIQALPTAGLSAEQIRQQGIRRLCQEAGPPKE